MSFMSFTVKSKKEKHIQWYRSGWSRGSRASTRLSHLMRFFICLLNSDMGDDVRGAVGVCHTRWYKSVWHSPFCPFDLSPTLLNVYSMQSYWITYRISLLKTLHLDINRSIITIIRSNIIAVVVLTMQILYCMLLAIFISCDLDGT